jgi:hypothetical protein
MFAVDQPLAQYLRCLLNGVSTDHLRYCSFRVKYNRHQRIEILMQNLDKTRSKLCLELYLSNQFF